VSGYTC